METVHKLNSLQLFNSLSYPEDGMMPSCWFYISSHIYPHDMDTVHLVGQILTMSDQNSHCFLSDVAVSGLMIYQLRLENK